MGFINHSTPIPTDSDLNDVHPSPKKTLCQDLPADKYYHLIMKEKLWKSWSQDSFGIYYAGDEKKPFEVDVKGKALSWRDRMVLRMPNTQTPVAVILKMHLKWETTFKIYSFVPYEEGQLASENQDHEGHPLYEWAECKDKFFSVRKTMTMFDGVKYVMDGVGKVIATHRQVRIARDDKPCVHMKEINLGIFTGNQWEIKIGPGIDPCIIIAFAAIMDEMNEDQKK
jgi:hypothetical protein